MTRRVSVGPRGVQANNGSGSPFISANGRFVAFRTEASNLVPGDTNGEPDVFVHDLEARRTVRASVGTGGVEGNGDSKFGAALSADGRYVAFTSESTNLVPGDTNGERDIYVRDLKAGTTRRASVGPGGVGGNRESRFPTISANGRFVAFDSRATNLVPGDTNGEFDVFVRDLEKGKTIRISTSTGGAQGDYRSIFGTISADGRVVVFDSDATNLVRGDTNGARDVFVRVPPVP